MDCNRHKLESISKYVLLIVTVLTVTLGTSCKKNTNQSNAPIEFYLLKNQNIIPGLCRIDTSRALEDDPFVENNEILSYNPSTYQYRLSDSAIEEVKVLRDNMPFAVTINKKIVFYALFKPSYSSSICFNAITMDMSWTSKDRITFNIASLSGITQVDDQRNSIVLIKALRSQGKIE